MIMTIRYLCVTKLYNTVPVCDKTIHSLNNKLTEVSSPLSRWFTKNYMQANASKFQYVLFGPTDNWLMTSYCMCTREWICNHHTV